MTSDMCETQKQRVEKVNWKRVDYRWGRIWGCDGYYSLEQISVGLIEVPIYF